MVGSNLTNTRGEEILALGNDFRRAHGRFVVLECDRIVRRVGDDDVRGRELFHHSTRSNLLLQHADARLDLRPAFRFLELVLDLLFGHAKFLGVLPELKRNVDRSDQYQTGADDQKRHAADPERMQNGRFDILATERKKLVDRPPQPQHGDQCHDSELGDCLDQFVETVGAEYALYAFQRIQSLGLERNRLHAE